MNGGVWLERLCDECSKRQHAFVQGYPKGYDLYADVEWKDGELEGPIQPQTSLFQYWP